MLLPVSNHHIIVPHKTPLNPSSEFCFFNFPIPLTRHYSKPPPPPVIPRLIYNHNLRPSATNSSAATSADIQTLPQTAIQRIAQKLRSLGYVEEKRENPQEPPKRNPDGPSPGEIFVPLPTKLPKYRVGHTLDSSWSTPENPLPEPGSGDVMQRFHELRRGVLRVKEEERLLRKKGREERENVVPTLAELTLPEEELKRLRTLGIGLKKRLKVGKAGITEGIVNGIHERWRRSEVVKIKCEDICRLNMKRTHDLLERKTGGLVVWRSGSNIILYRGDNYEYPYFFSDDNSINDASGESSPEICTDCGGPSGGEDRPSSTDHATSLGPRSSIEVSNLNLVQGVGSPGRVRFQLPGEAQLAEEADRLLEGLGPRFTDWWGYDPLPVDADLLPAVVAGYRRPFRLLPYGVKPKLTNDEMTTLRRLGRPLPCHFALGRNRKLQGLAASIVKLWEKCEIAKVAVKRGVQNTNSELMAEELKRLTGGTLLSRDKEFIVLYRGKDFLPAAVSSAIEERRKCGIHGQQNEIDHSSVKNVKELKFGNVGSASPGKLVEPTDEKVVCEQKKLSSAEVAIRKTSSKLSMALAKKARAEKLLEELGKEEINQEPELDKEGISEEERYMLRKVGLRMKPFLLLGRRGVFAGTVENMHLHWKYRELVKIIMGGRSIEEVHGVARTLEAESGGILVAVERVNKGFAIIVYRGKNYERPPCLRPHTLLNKREAMKRSIEAQRRQSLKLHVLKLSQTVDELKLQLDKDKEINNTRVAKEPDSGTELQKDSSFRYELGDSNKFDTTGTEPSQEAVPTEAKYVDTNGENYEPRQTKASPTTSLVFKEMAVQLPVDSVKTELGPTINKNTEDESSVPVRAARVTNRERLLLRKQALRMKKRPVLAVGKSNIVSGVAKTIKTHFQKYPLAIVNIKGRATGTSVQEVVFKLEQATGAVLVSQEPSKVILYRGWGAGEDPVQSDGKARNSSGEGSHRPVISAELMSAIRLECGLQDNHDNQEAA